MDFGETQSLMSAEPFLGDLRLDVLEAQVGSVVLHLQTRQDVTSHTGSIPGGMQYGLDGATAIALAATLITAQAGVRSTCGMDA